MTDNSKEVERLEKENKFLRDRLKELENNGMRSPWKPAGLDGIAPLTAVAAGPGEGRNSDGYLFEELVDIPRLQALLDVLSEVASIPTAVLSPDGKILTQSGWQEVCTEFHRKCPETEKRCMESDNYISEHLRDGPFVSYRCKNGLYDCACPILVEGRHVATLFTGQLFLHPPDEAFFRAQAREHGFDEESYMEAVRKVPVIPQELLTKNINLLLELARMLVDIGSATMSERLHARRELSESEHRFRVVFEQANIGKVLFDTEGAITKVNQAFCEMLGYSEEELLGMPWKSLFHHANESENGDTLSLLLAGKQDKFRTESRFFHKESRIVWASVVTIVVRSEDGRPQFFMSHVMDISDQKSSEMLLRETMYRLEKSQSVARLGGWEFDPVNDVIKGSTEFYRLFEREPEQLSRLRDILDSLSPEDAERISRELDDAFQSGTPLCTEFRISLGRGKWRDFEARGEVSYDDQDNPIRMMGTCMDITDRKTAERHAAREERKAKTFLEGTSDIVTVVDAQGKFISVNPATCRILGAKYEDIIGTMAFDFVHPDDKEATLISFNEWISNKVTSASYENRQIACDGRVVHALWTIMPQFENGELTEVWSIARDITNRKEQEERLNMLNESLIRSNQELEQFAYVASHDLQEPLRMVSSYTQLLAKRYNDQLDQDAKDFIGFAVDGANRMQRLIQDLLTFSRVTTRGKPMAEFDAQDALGAAVVNLQSAIMETGAIVSNSNLPRVLGDSSQISMLMQNLIGNAIKFHKPDEPPRVYVDAVKDEEHAGYWTFSLRDNGIGIEEKYFNRLFVIFQRLHGRQEYPGTGIGLAICKRIVERHGGKIWLESVPGVGTTFYFTLLSGDSNERDWR